MRTLVIAAALALLQSGAAVAQYGSYPPQQGRVGVGPGSLRGWGYTPEARIWIEGNRDYYRRGERLRPVFSTSADAYVAVIHIDPDGRLEFLYPSSPFDREYVRGGQSYPLPYRGASSGLMVRGGAGIGYLYLVASPVPLDYGYFRGRAGSTWDWSYAGQTVRGDPFWAMEQITRRLVPDYYAPVAVDYFSYQIEGLHRYPSYACNSRYYGAQPATSWGWGWGGGYTPSYYGSCDRLDYYLRENPYYFDAARYRGDRRSQFRNYGSREPQYRYKEDPEARTGTGTARAVAPAPSGGNRGGTAAPTEPTRRPAPRAEPERAPAAAPARGATPSGSTPAVRRVSPGSGESGGSAAPSGSRGSSGSSGGAGTTEPRRRSPSD
jgi:hypothetical protein